MELNKNKAKLLGILLGLIGITLLTQPRYIKPQNPVLNEVQMEYKTLCGKHIKLEPIYYTCDDMKQYLIKRGINVHN